MLSRGALFVLFSTMVACGSPTPSAGTPPMEVPPAEEVDAGPNVLAEGLDALFTKAEADDAFAGSVIVVDGGKQVFEKGYGFADRNTKRKNTPETIFRVGSVSKQFTATAVLALVQDGKLALTDPISKFFPSYPKENLAMDGQEVTVHHILSQTSGLPDPGKVDAFGDAAWRRPIDPQEQIDLVKSMPLVRKPGQKFVYNNFNYLLAALIVEQVAGQPFDAFMHARFFEPLGMKATGTLLPKSEQERAAVGYYKKEDGTIYVLADDPKFNKDPDVTVAYGSGQIFSTVRDLAQWDRALAGEGVLEAAQRDLLFEPNVADYGYGWVIEKKSDITIEWHNGALMPLGFSAFIVRIPSKDRFVAYLANLDINHVQPFEEKVVALAIK